MRLMFHLHFKTFLFYAQHSPHSANILIPDSPASQQLQQDRKPQAVKRSMISWWWA